MTEDLADYWRRRAEQAEQRAHDIANATAPLQLELTMAQADVAALRAELDAARAVVRAATLLGTGPDSVTWTAMYEAIEAYDAAVKARR